MRTSVERDGEYMTVPEETERIPPDIKLLNDMVIALTISFRNAGIYPRNHPALDISLRRAADLFERLFEYRLSLTLAVGKDTLIIDNFPLDKKNSSFSQFARLLDKLNIAHVTFERGLSKDELYVFQHLVSKQLRELSPAALEEFFQGQALTHIKIGFADYSSFSLEQGKTCEQIAQEDLWETYILGLVSGTLNMEGVQELDEVSSEILAKVINKLSKESPDNASGNTFFTLYLQKVFQKPVTTAEIKKLLDLVSKLEPDLKGQFISLMAGMLSRNITLAAKSLNSISPDMMLTLLETMKSQKISIPDNLRNLLDKLLGLAQGEDNDPLNLKGSCFVDDVFLPSEMVAILSKSELERTVYDTFETFVSDEYQREIQKLSELSRTEKFSTSLAEIKRECDDDYVDTIYYLILFEIMASDVISEKEYRKFLAYLEEQTLQFIATGQYRQVLQTIKLLQSNIEKNTQGNITSEALRYYFTDKMFHAFIASMKVMGKQVRDEAWELCAFYGAAIIPFLVAALVDEDSKSFRSFLMGFLKQFGQALVPYAIKGLDDPRWFVKRNMLSLLIGCKDKEIIPLIRPYCHHKNDRVRLDAIKCLLSLEDFYGIEILTKYLHSSSRAEVELAISLIGTFRVREAIPEAVGLLKGEGAIKADLALKLLIIQALGNTGDPRCLDAFRKIVSSKRLFFNKDAEKMKEEIFKILKHFARSDVEDIVRQGIKSRNKIIRDESLLLNKVGK